MPTPWCVANAEFGHETRSSGRGHGVVAAAQASRNTNHDLRSATELVQTLEIAAYLVAIVVAGEPFVAFYATVRESHPRYLLLAVAGAAQWPPEAESPHS